MIIITASKHQFKYTGNIFLIFSNNMLYIEWWSISKLAGEFNWDEHGFDNFFIDDIESICGE
jgi:hypothetical protein